MIGKESVQELRGERHREEETLSVSLSASGSPFSFARRARGFTLLELMIVISIVVILALVALPMYNKSVTAAREAVLRDNLFQMRKLIDQYAADKGKLPASLDDIVTAGYMREIPEDPITGEADWVTVQGEDPNAREGETGIVNICSNSPDTATDGSSYNDCEKW
ncbi:MAG TPA: type II secretion system protein [Pyrinomonadaceae bacterium]